MFDFRVPRLLLAHWARYDGAWRRLPPRYFVSVQRNVMIHYSCDRCQRLIDTDDEVRYVVRLEIESKLGEDVFVDEERDHLLEMHEIIEQAATNGESLGDDEVYQRTRFDLCGECYRAFLSNPMGREGAKSVGFSEN